MKDKNYGFGVIGGFPFGSTCVGSIQTARAVYN